MQKIWFLGESLIDFVPTTSDGQVAYLPRCGGSPLNAAIAAARQEVDVGFLGALSTDLFGERLADYLAENSVDISRAPRVPHHSTLAFVDLEKAEPRYAFFNAMSATQLIDPDPAQFEPGKGDILHVGSIALIDNPGADNIARFVEAVGPKMLVSIDPNARPSMTPDAEEWKARINRIIARADIVKISQEDLEYLAGEISPPQYAAQLVEKGTGLVLVTMGNSGALARTASGEARVAARNGAIEDTVGAGDTVTGSLLASIVERSCASRADIAKLADNDIKEILERCMVAAALNCAKSGCQPPSRTETLAALGH